MGKQVFSTTVLVSFVFFLSHGINAIGSKDMAFIESVCKKTHDYKLCVTCLKSNPRSFNADVKGLALIMMEAMQSKVDGILKVISRLRNNTSDPDMQSCLDDACHEEYANITPFIQFAIEHLQSNSLDFALLGVDDAYLGIQACEECTPPKSSMTPINTYFVSLLKITEDILRILMK
ncbi:cell wall [Dorcoceras hygrometricum]|uniref:Cell wall n=1 Tax=Dorcoceras hygrometricum TaxID=472368 RepID=A0A2Z7BRQ2_9LAMI|nr:cell wall [Dorcoceras hygrometricum]